MLKRVDQPRETVPPAELESAATGPIDFDFVLAAARRQAPMIAAIAILGLVAGWVYLRAAVPLYTATTNILIDSLKDQHTVAATIADLTFDSAAIDSQVEVLKSEKVALSVTSAMNLTKDAEFMAGPKTLMGDTLGRLRAMLDVGSWFARPQKAEASPGSLEETAVGWLQSGLDVRRLGRTYVLAVSYTSPDSGKASAIANAFADAYLNEQLDAKFEATRRAADWLETRIAELKRHSLAADLAVQKFKADKGIVATGGDKPTLLSDQELSQINEQMVLARADTARADAKYAQLEELLNSGKPGVSVPDSLASPIIAELREKYLTDSKMAAQLEAKLGSTHLQVINLKKEMEQFERLIRDELQRIAESNHSEAEVARAKEKSLAQSLSGLAGASALTNETLVQLRELERESETYRNLYQTFMQRYQETLQQQTFPVGEARVITAATRPSTPSFPKRSSILALSLLIGAVAGASLGALREYRDRMFRVAAHVREELGLEFLGVLETVGSPTTLRSAKGEYPDPRQIRPTTSLQRYTIDHPLSSFSETLRAAKVAIDLALGDRKPKIVGVISALPNEGKTTVAKNFASLLAHLGARTILIDADLRNPGLTASVARHAQAGLLEAIQGERPVGDLLLYEPDSGLFVLPTVVRERVQHSSEVLSSPGMRKVVARVGDAFDYVIVDAPPLGPVVDVRAAASLFDAFLLVVEWGRTPRVMVKNILDSDSALREKCVGVVYNKVNMKVISRYGDYGSKEYYFRRYNKYYHKNAG
jgi:succinoglycan biosynthesis transport protein ExoP